MVRYPVRSRRARPCGSSPGSGWSSSAAWPSGRPWCAGIRSWGCPSRALALTVGLAGLTRPEWMRSIYVGWMVLAFPIGWTVSQVMLALMFFGLFTPIGLVFRLIGRDPLQRARRTRVGNRTGPPSRPRPT